MVEGVDGDDEEREHHDHDEETDESFDAGFGREEEVFVCSFEGRFLEGEISLFFFDFSNFPRR